MATMQHRRTTVESILKIDISQNKNVPIRTVFINPVTYSYICEGCVCHTQVQAKCYGIT